MASEIKSGDILNLESINSNKKIYAGPGAGKTYFLINNIKEMFKRDTKIYGSKSKKILCITYTNSAVDEIKILISDENNNDYDMVLSENDFEFNLLDKIKEKYL